METLDTITRIFMISSLGAMIVYAITKGFEAINKATTEELTLEDMMNNENEINESTEIMDYDEAVQYYVMKCDEEEREVNLD